MNKRIINNNSISKAACLSHFSPFETKLKADSINLELAFVISGESITILPKLIISNLNQRLTIQPNDLLNIQSCSVLRLTTGTAYLYSMFSNGVTQGTLLG